MRARKGRWTFTCAFGPTELEVIVSDDGVGIRPNVPEPDLEVQGLGLSLIQALTDRVEFLGGMGEGTKVRMSFAFDGGPDVVSDRRPRGRA